jgi:hypothetical protein
MSESPEQIQQDIDRSRQEAAQKVDQIGSQLHDATVQARDVVRQDMPDMIKEGLDVTKAELKEDLTKVGAGSAAIAGGTVLGAVGGFFLLQSVMELLAQRLTRWQAAGIMGLGLTGTAVALGFGGKEQLKPDQLKPKRTMSVLQQTTAWTKAQMRSLRSRAAAEPSSASTPEATQQGM